MMMRAYVHGFLGAALMAGCGPTAEQLELQRLATMVHSLQAQMARQDQRGEEMSNRVIVLSHRLDALKDVASRAAAQPTPETVPAPPNLEVVKLRPDESNPTPQPAYPEAADGGFEAEEPPIQITLTGTSALDPLGVTPVPPPPAAGPEQTFRAALDAYRAGDNAEAHERFAEFVRAFPEHEHVDNALYWMGECRFERGQFESALVELAKVIERYPSSNKTPDALLKMGLAYEKLGRNAEARELFERVTATYPNSALAELARARLATGKVGERRVR